MPDNLPCHIGSPMKAMKFCSPDGIRIIGWNDINHLNEHTIILITFSETMPQKSNMAMTYAILNYVAAHHSLFSSWGVDLKPANMKHHIQLQLLLTASVLIAAMALIISIDANNWYDITWGVGQYSHFVVGTAQKYMEWKFLLSSTHLCILYCLEVCR